MTLLSRTLSRSVVLSAAVVAAGIGVSGPASAQLQRTFDPGRNGPWIVHPLGAGTDAPDSTSEPRSLVVGGDGAVYLATKVPVQGAPTGGLVFRVGLERLEPLGKRIAEDPSQLLVDGSTLLLGTKGTPSERKGTVHRFDGAEWNALLDTGAEAEVLSLARHAGALFLGTKSAGVLRIDGERVSRTGAKTTTLPNGFVWTKLGTWSADMERIGRNAAGELFGVGKDLHVRTWNGTAWADLGNVADATYDATGLPTVFAREPKALAFDGTGRPLIGTKGRTGSAEGADIGLLFRWSGMAWAPVGSPTTIRKEVKTALWFGDDDVVVGSNDTGVWRWDGTAWTSDSAGLPVTSGKTKSERIILAGSTLYLAETNKVFTSPLGKPFVWTEHAIFDAGEEVKALAFHAGALYVGAKVGASAGAVYRRDGAAWTQIGPDLPRDVDKLTIVSPSEIYAVLGGGAGAYRFDGTAWSPIAGALLGPAAEFKDLVVTGPNAFLAATKDGVYRGEFRDEPLTVVDFALKNKEVVATLDVGGQLLAVCKKGGVYRLVPGAATDDGNTWEPATEGLPDVELSGATVLDGRVYLFGTKLLYRGEVTGGTLRVAPLGKNPGRAALDGNGNVVFSGETETTAAALLPDGTLAIGTKDGLFVTGDDGATWTLLNGPAEIKALAVAGTHLYVGVKEQRTPDPQQPAFTVDSAAIWLRDLAAAPIAVAPSRDPEVSDSGCSTHGSTHGITTGRAAGGTGLVVALAVLAMRRHRRRVSRA